MAPTLPAWPLQGSGQAQDEHAFVQPQIGALPTLAQGSSHAQGGGGLVERVVCKVLLGAPEAAGALLLDAERRGEAR